MSLMLNTAQAVAVHDSPKLVPQSSTVRESQDSPKVVGRSRTSNSDDVVFGIASKMFINLRIYPDILCALRFLVDKHTTDLCKSVILESLFPDDGNIDTEIQLSRLLGKFVYLEVVNCKELETLFRDNSLAALLASSYCKRRSAQKFLLEFLDPILKDVVLNHDIHWGDAERTALTQSLLQRIVSVVCAKVHSLPLGVTFMAESVFAGMRTLSSDHHERLSGHYAGAIIFLRFIVPYIAMYDHSNSNNLSSSEHSVIQAFYLEVASGLMKISSGTPFPPFHKLSVLNETVQELSVSVHAAFFRISSEVVLERVQGMSRGNRAMSAAVKVDVLLSFMQALVSVRNSVDIQIEAADECVSAHRAVCAAVNEYACLPQPTISMSKCVLTGGEVTIPLADVSSLSLDLFLDSLSPMPIANIAPSTPAIISKAAKFSDWQTKNIAEAAMIVQDSISGRMFHMNRPVISSKTCFGRIAPIAYHMTRSIIFQRFILILCLLHCFMAVYETRSFKDYKTRELCLVAAPDESILFNIFVSESVIIAFYWAFFFAKVLTRSGKIGGWTLVQFTVTVVLTIDLLYNWANHYINRSQLIRFGTPLRPVMQIVRTTQIAHALRQHLHELYFTITSAKYMFAIITVYCLIVGIIMNIFVRTVCAGCDSVGCVVTADDGSSRVKMCNLFNTRFSTSGSSILTAFVLITASNYNDIAEMLLAYMDQSQDKGRALLFFFFLMVVVIVGYFLLLPLLLAVVVSSYKKARQNSADKDIASLQLALASAFDLLLSTEGRSDSISEHIYCCFMKACNLNFSDKEISLFFQYLDTDLSKSLSIDEFTQLFDIMSLSLRKGFSKRISHYFISLGTFGKGHTLFRTVFQHRQFRVLVSVVIFINVCIYIWMGSLPSSIRSSDNYSSNSSRVFFSYDCVSEKFESSCRQAQAAEIIDFLLFLFYCFEMILSFASYGLSSIFMPWVIFNTALISFSSIFYLLAYFGFGVTPVYVSVFRLVNLVRVLRMFELSGNFKALLQSIRGSLRGFSSFIIFSVSTVFSWAFIALLMLQCNQVGGNFNPDNLNGTPINFDSLTGSVLSLFQITVVDNWDDFIWSAQESKSLSFGAFYSLYFLAFFLILVLVITNVLTSSIIESYDEQVQREEKTRTASAGSGSVFIDGVEFVKAGAAISSVNQKSVSGKSPKPHPSNTRDMYSSVSAFARRPDAFGTSETDAAVSSSDREDPQAARATEDPSSSSSHSPNDEKMSASDEPKRHPSLIFKVGTLKYFKTSSGKMLLRSCSINSKKFQIFSRRDQLRASLSISAGDLTSVRNELDSPQDILFPIVLRWLHEGAQRSVILCAASAADQQEWTEVFEEVLASRRYRSVVSAEQEYKWREYVSNARKEVAKVLNQLIESLLHPLEDLQRYVTVLEHLCWLADELGESEIICPIVEYTTSLTPQLQHVLRASKVFMRGDAAVGCDSSSDSDMDTTPNFQQVVHSMLHANSRTASPKLDRRPLQQLTLNSGSREEISQGPRLDFAAKSNGFVVNSPDDRYSSRRSFPVEPIVPGDSSIESTIRALVEADFLKHIGQSHASSQMAQTALHLMHQQVAQLDLQAAENQFEMTELRGSAQSSQVASEQSKVRELLAELDSIGVECTAGSSPRAAFPQRPLPPPVAYSATASPRLRKQQEEAMAELHLALQMASMTTGSSMHHSVAVTGSQLHPLNQQEQTKDHSEILDPAAIPPSAPTLEQQQQQALAELEAVLRQPQLLSASSSDVLRSPFPLNDSPHISSRSAGSMIPPGSSNASVQAVQCDPLHLLRAPGATSSGDDSDPEFTEFLNKLDS